MSCLLPLAMLLVASSWQVLAQGGQIPKPESQSALEQSLIAIATGPSSETLQSIKDSQIMTASALSNVLTALSRVAGAGDPAKWLVLQPHVHRLVPYLRTHDPSGAAVGALRTLLQGGSSVEALVAQDKELLAFARAFDPSAFLTWAMATPKEDMPGKSDASTRRQAKTNPKKGKKPARPPPPPPKKGKKPSKPAPKSRPIGNDPNDPVDQLYDWAARVKTLGGSVQFLVQGEARRRSRSLLALDGDYQPEASPSDSEAVSAAAVGEQLLAGARQLRGASAAKLAENVGFDWFKPRKIGVVFHMLQFRDKRKYLYPPQVYWNGDDPAKRLLDTINKLYRYSGTNIQFYLKDYRINVGMHPYLDMGNLTDWQDCGNSMTECTCTLSKHNYQPHKYLNVFVAGSNAYRGYNNTQASAQTSAAAGFLDLCQPYSNPNADLFVWSNKHSPRLQHVWMTFDYADPLQYNSAEFRNLGGTTLGHEFGHIMGLLHTFQPPISVLPELFACDDGDDVPDTPPEDKEGAWKNGTLVDTLSTLCRGIARTGQLPKRAQLAKFDSCPGDAYIDNVFNFMNYVPSACNLMITRGQVRYMQKKVQKYLKNLGDVW